MLRFLPTALLLSGALLLALALAGCGKAAPLYCDETTPCTDPDRPFCDLAGVFPESDGHGRTCIADPGGGEPDAATACVADTVSCDGDTLVDCGPDGSPRATETCPLGCKADEARCLTFLPSNGVALDGAEDGPDLTLGDGAIIDTTEGTITDGNGSPVLVASKLLPALQGGVEIRVFQFKTLTLGDTTVIGWSGRECRFSRGSRSGPRPEASEQAAAEAAPAPALAAEADSANLAATVVRKAQTLVEPAAPRRAPRPSSHCAAAATGRTMVSKLPASRRQSVPHIAALAAVQSSSQVDRRSHSRMAPQSRHQASVT
jgi:hypothetical protein